MPSSCQLLKKRNKNIITTISCLFKVIVDMSNNKQSEGNNAMWQSRKRDSDSVISFQKCLMGVQC